MNYKQLVENVVNENKTVLNKVAEEELQTLLTAIEGAKKIQIYAMGRMQLAVRGFAALLKLMGFNVYVVYDTTTPSIGEDDLLINFCGVTPVELNIIQCAKEAGAKVGVITACPENKLGRLADFTVRVPGHIFGGNMEVASEQPMAMLLEQSLFLFADIVSQMLIERNHVTLDDMHTRHTNLEGLVE